MRIDYPAAVQKPAGQSEPLSPPSRLPGRPVRIYMMDLLSIVPYYTGHLVSALNRQAGLQLRLGSITYHLDRDYFSREKLKLRPGLNLASKLPSRPAALRRFLKLLEYLLNLSALPLRFCVSRPDILHVQFLPMLARGVPIDLWFLGIVQRLGIRVVYTVHNLLPHDTGESRRSLYQRAYRMADVLICHDRSVRERLIDEFGVMPSRIHVISHGPLFAASSGFSQDRARRRLGISGEQVLVLCQGILRPYKGIPFLLKAWQQIQAANPDARLAVVGTGDAALTRAIDEEVAALGISRSVRLELRFVTAGEVALFYEAADILVYPYSELTTSGALMTGIGYGKAIVTTRLRAFESVLQDGTNALMVRYGDVDGLAATLLTLAAQPVTRCQLGQAAKQAFLACPGWSEIASEMAGIYRTLLED